MATRGISFSFEWQPTIPTLMRDFELISNRIKSLRDPLHDSVKKVVLPSIRKNFDVGGRPAWDGLDEDTLDHKRRYNARRITIPLQRTGKLRAAANLLGNWTFDGQAGEARMAPPRGAEYGTFHQDGTIFMPARSWAVIQPEDLDAIEKVFEGWLRDKFIEGGFR